MLYSQYNFVVVANFDHKSIITIICYDIQHNVIKSENYDGGIFYARSNDCHCIHKIISSRRTLHMKGDLGKSLLSADSNTSWQIWHRSSAKAGTRELCGFLSLPTSPWFCSNYLLHPHTQPDADHRDERRSFRIQSLVLSRKVKFYQIVYMYRKYIWLENAWVSSILSFY